MADFHPRCLRFYLICPQLGHFVHSRPTNRRNTVYDSALLATLSFH
jgi:hypothetical protein